MKPYSRVYAAINLDAVAANMEAMKANLPASTSMIGVVKTDGYGHGAVPVARTIDPYVDGYAVVSVDEGIILRRHGIRKMVLVLGVTHESRFEDLVRYDIRPAMFRYGEAQKLSAVAAAMGKRANIHLAVDTGMNRIGMKPDQESADMVLRISMLEGIRIEGMFTHFARADEADKTTYGLQFGKYSDFVEMLGSRGINIPIRLCSNSAGIIDLPQANLNCVRAGITMYGMYPSEEVQKDKVPLKPALGLKSFVTYVKELGPGEEISYGGTYVTERTMRIATVAVGYGDGYPRSLSNCGYVLICGKRARILGRVCMDQLMVDVTDIMEADVDTPVTLIGKDGDEEITMEHLAELCGGFHYEMVCDIGKRVPRVYYRGGKVVGTMDCFAE